VAIAAVALLVVACRGNRDPPQRGARGPPSIDQALTVGESLYFRAEYDSAGAVWREALGRAMREADSGAEARVRTWLGLLARKLGDYATARHESEQALALKEAIGLEREIAKSCNALGLIAWDQSHPREALSWFECADSLGRRFGDARVVATAAANIPLQYVDLGDFAAARRGYTAAREAAQTLGDPRILGNIITNSAALEVQVGHPAAAIPLLLRGRAAYRAAGMAAQEQNAIGQLSTAYAALGEWRLAFGALDSALALVRAQGLRQEEASNLEILAGLHQGAGDHRRALALYAQARTINAELGLELETASDLRSEAEIDLALGDGERARRNVTDALTIHRRLETRWEELLDRVVLAEIAAVSAHTAEARQHLASAGALARLVDTRLARVTVALTTARIEERRGDARRALAALDDAGGDLAAGGYGTEWEAAHLRARSLELLGRYAEAVVAGRQAVSAVERARGGYGSEMLRTTFAADRRAVYGDHAGTLLRLGLLEEAFAVSDASRGRALAERLASGAPGEREDPTLRAVREGEDLLGTIDALVTHIDEYEAMLVRTPDSGLAAVVDGLYAALRRTRGEYEAAYARMRERDGAALLAAAPADVRSIRESLAVGEVLLEYLVTPDRLLIFAVTREGVRAVERSIDAQRLGARVRLVRELLGSPRSRTGVAEPALEALYEDLIAPVAGSLEGASRLLVVPHAVLTYLPFAALRNPVSSRYLVESHAIAVLPSAAALPELRGRASSAVPFAGAAFAPTPDKLPASRDEAFAVRSALRGVRVSLGRRARERDVRRALGEGGVVHVAAHGVLNPAHPLFSRIELARGGNRAGPEDDGRLEVHEVLDQRIVSQLVFLSGCETGLGAAASTAFDVGEDFAALSRAFLYAGARDVVATLWRVEDAGGAAFAGAFYRHLQVLPPVEAIAAAQRALLREGPFREPYHWAAYILSGGGGVGGLLQGGLPESVVSGNGGSSP
jgi:CHAT domain-containing protein/tetratricopeptide (TPR) repeat protein